MVKHSSHEATNVGSSPAKPNLILESSQVGKAPVFGTGIGGSSPSTPEAKVVELVYTLGLGSSPLKDRGSTPLFGNVAA